ncbi:hypothetical protein F7725_021338 [Dissostichus mawsoni]|uniref:rhomboid protease n=1 Tax=Dissostichus mawsoni TaxID=36200 RepID=A0A7J5YFZ6_DISMA|nr:hypothetical protein F7725_021338 [Dissostichus mawsoni]
MGNVCVDGAAVSVLQGALSPDSLLSVSPEMMHLPRVTGSPTWRGGAARFCSDSPEKMLYGAPRGAADQPMVEQLERGSEDGIIAANAIVFCCWRIPSLQRSMLKYFTADPASKTLCAPMLLSTFSHFSFFHLAANMYVLWSFSSSAVSMLGREHYFCKTATGRFGPSLGAKELKVCLQKELKVCLQKELKVCLQKELKALKAIVAMDTAGVVLGWRYFDHAAHLGGALFGIWYIMFGHELIWKNREPFVKLWHELRTGGGRGGGGGGEGGAV